MLNFLKSAFSQTPLEVESLVEEFVRQESRLYPFDLKNFKAGVKFQNADPPMQRAIIMALLAWLGSHPLRMNPPHNQKEWQLGWKMREIFLHMLKRKLPFEERDVVAMLHWSAGQLSDNLFYTYLSGVPQMIKVVGDYLKGHPMSDELYQAIERLIRAVDKDQTRVEARRWVLRLRELRGDTEVALPVAAGDVWAATALSELRALDPKVQTAWAELLLHCLRATGSAPSAKWLKGTAKSLEVIGTSNFFNGLLRWFALVDKPRTVQTSRYDNLQTLLPVNADILKGLAWLCSKSEDPEIARALTTLAISSYRKIPGAGPRATKVGNACFWALGSMPGREGVAQLSILKVRIKTNTAQKLIANALEIAARRLGLSA